MKKSSERYLRPPKPDAISQQHDFMCMSTTVEELSYTPSQAEKTRDAAQVVATGRKSWKTLRGKGEAVWPPVLEAALIEALEIYQQESIRSRAKKTGRFPMRNRFVSDYIHEVTGKRRTPKQVGSRLQQLRDTCKGDKIRHLISHRGGSPTPEWQTAGSQSDCSSRASMTPPPDHPSPSPVSTYIHVLICLQKDLRPCPVPAVHLIENDSMNPHVIKLSPRSYADPKMKASACSILSYLSGTVEFPSSCGLVLQSTFHVYLDGSDTPLHSEIAPLKCLSSGLYSSELAPDFWNTLCSTDDPRRYTIIQSLKPISSSFNETNRVCPTVFVAYSFDFQGPAVRQTSYDTTMASSTYPMSYPTSASTYNNSMSMVSDYTQWQVPPEDVDTKLNYSQMRLLHEQTPYGVPPTTFPESSMQLAYNNTTIQPPPVPMQRHDYPVPVLDSYEQPPNYYYPNSTSSPWSNERNSGQGRYWQ